MGKTKFATFTRFWCGHVHFRIGSLTQIRVNKGFRPSTFKSLGEAIEFARTCKRLRPSTVAESLRGPWHFAKKEREANSSMQCDPGKVFVNQDSGKTLAPTAASLVAAELNNLPLTRENLLKLEKLLGVTLKRGKSEASRRV